MFLPEDQRNVVGKAKQDKEIMATDDWQAAKERADFSAARRVVDRVWSDKKTGQLLAGLGDLNRVVLMTQPSTSGQNVIPIALAQRLADELGAEYIKGDDCFDVLHGQQSKHIPPYRRVFERREYETVDPVTLKEKIGGRDVVIVEDILTTGGSVADFTNHLLNEGIKTVSITALMGDKRLKLDQKTFEKLDQAIQNKQLPIRTSDLVPHITRAEAGGLVMMINSMGSANARDKITRNLQGLCDKRIVKDLGGNSIAVRYEAPEGPDKGNASIAERVQAWPSQGHTGLMEYKSQKEAFLKSLAQGKEKAVEKSMVKDVGKGLEY